MCITTSIDCYIYLKHLKCTSTLLIDIRVLAQGHDYKSFRRTNNVDFVVYNLCVEGLQLLASDIKKNRIERNRHLLYF